MCPGNFTFHFGPRFVPTGGQPIHGISNPYPGRINNSIMRRPRDSIRLQESSAEFFLFLAPLLCREQSLASPREGKKKKKNYLKVVNTPSCLGISRLRPVSVLEFQAFIFSSARQFLPHIFFHTPLQSGNTESPSPRPQDHLPSHRKILARPPGISKSFLSPRKTRASQNSRRSAKKENRNK
jgi:hypothetical protein